MTVGSLGVTRALLVLDARLLDRVLLEGGERTRQRADLVAPLAERRLGRQIARVLSCREQLRNHWRERDQQHCEQCEHETRALMETAAHVRQT